MESKFHNDWADLRLFLPKGWSSKAKQMGVFSRKRQFKSVGILLRTLLIHLLEGCSLKETAVRAEQGGLCKVSSVAIFKRLRQSGEWFNWMSLRLAERRGVKITPPLWLKDYNVKTVDASIISEPGSTGTDWRLHYSMSLFSLRADQFKLTSSEVGESFKHFNVEPGELWLGDRAYCHYSHLSYLVNNKADFIVRWRAKATRLFIDEQPFDLLESLKKLKVGQFGDWTLEARLANKETGFPIRICAIRKSSYKAEESTREYKKKALKKGGKYSLVTLKLQKYIIVATSLPKSIAAIKVLELYRARWQEEIAFKRMKSLIGIGHLPKTDMESCLAWLQGKLFISLLVQAVHDEGRLFSPWGYPLSRQ